MSVLIYVDISSATAKSAIIKMKSMKKVVKKKNSGRTLSSIFDNLLKEEKITKTLRPLTEVEKAKLEQEIAIEQLYYSSKLEGSHLTSEAIEKAIHGKEV